MAWMAAAGMFLYNRKQQGAAAKQQQTLLNNTFTAKKPFMPDNETIQRNAMRAVAARKGSRANTVLTSQTDGSTLA